MLKRNSKRNYSLEQLRAAWGAGVAEGKKGSEFPQYPSHVTKFWRVLSSHYPVPKLLDPAIAGHISALYEAVKGQLAFLRSVLNTETVKIGEVFLSIYEVASVYLDCETALKTADLRISNFLEEHFRDVLWDAELIRFLMDRPLHNGLVVPKVSRLPLKRSIYRHEILLNACFEGE